MGGFFGGGGGGGGGGFLSSRRNAATMRNLVTSQQPVSSAPVSQAAAQIRNAVGQVIDTSAPTVSPSIVGTVGTMGATQAVKGGKRARGRVASLLTDMGGGFEQLGGTS